MCLETLNFHILLTLAELARSVTNTPGQADANNCTNQLEFTCIPNDNSPQLDFTNINHSKSDQSHRLSFHSGNSFQLLDLAGKHYFFYQENYISLI